MIQSTSVYLNVHRGFRPFNVIAATSTRSSFSAAGSVKNQASDMSRELENMIERGPGMLICIIIMKLSKVL